MTSIMLSIGSCAEMNVQTKMSKIKLATYLNKFIQDHLHVTRTVHKMLTRRVLADRYRIRQEQFQYHRVLEILLCYSISFTCVRDRTLRV